MIPYTSIFLPITMVLFPMPKSFGVNHSLTSSLVVSKTQVGKFAVNCKHVKRSIEINLLCLKEIMSEKVLTKE